jgi:hypothetical protein
VGCLRLDSTVAALGTRKTSDVIKFGIKFDFLFRRYEICALHTPMKVDLGKAMPVEDKIINRNTLVSEGLMTERTEKTFRMPDVTRHLEEVGINRTLTTWTAAG